MLAVVLVALLMLTVSSPYGSIAGEGTATSADQKKPESDAV